MDEEFESEADRVYAALNEMQEQLLKLGERLDSIESAGARAGGGGGGGAGGQSLERLSQRIDALETRQAALVASMAALHNEAMAAASGGRDRDFTCRILQCSAVRVVDAAGASRIVVDTTPERDPTITLLDGEGAERVLLLAGSSETRLEMRDADGKTRALIEAEKSRTSLELHCSDEVRSSIAMFADTLASKISLHHCNGAERLQIFIDEETPLRPVGVRILGADHADERIVLRVDANPLTNDAEDHASVLLLTNRDGGASIEASSSDFGADLGIVDRNGVPRIRLEVADETGASLEFRDPHDETRLWANTDEKQDLVQVHFFDGDGEHRAGAQVHVGSVEVATWEKSQSSADAPESENEPTQDGCAEAEAEAEDEDEDDDIERAGDDAPRDDSPR